MFVMKMENQQKNKIKQKNILTCRRTPLMKLKKRVKNKSIKRKPSQSSLSKNKIKSKKTKRIFTVQIVML